MAKKNTTPQDSAQALTPEEKIKALEAANKQLEKDLKKAKKDSKEPKAAKPKDLVFEVDELDEEGEETGEVLKYRFTVPRFNIDKVDYNSADVVEGAQSKDVKESEKNLLVLSQLVDMNSGIIEQID